MTLYEFLNEAFLYLVWACIGWLGAVATHRLWCKHDDEKQAEKD